MFDRFFGGSDDPDEDSDEEGIQNLTPSEITDDENAPPNFLPDPDEDISEPDEFSVDYATEFDPSTSQSHFGDEYLVEDYEGEPYMGEWGREMVEGGWGNQDEPTWVGYNDRTSHELQEVGISKRNWTRHAAMFGTTGSGKSTALVNVMTQVMYQGHGLCYIDPKGDDIFDLLQRIPPHRLDDVVWIDTDHTNHDKVVGLNFMDTGSIEIDEDGEGGSDSSIQESILDDLTAIMRDEGYWGVKMNGIFKNLVRGMLSNDNVNFTIIDLYEFFFDDEYQEEFLNNVEDPLAKYTEQIVEEMDSADYDALQRRIQQWVENEITLELIGYRESTFSLREAVNDEKIILVNNGVDNEDAKRLVSNGVMRWIWSAVQARSEEQEDDQFFLVVDEFDDVVSEESDVGRMLSKARSKGLSLCLACQQPSQLGRDIQDDIFGNTNNMFAMNVRLPSDASTIMSLFKDRNKDDLINLDSYKMYSQIELPGGEKSQTFITNTFAEYPPIWTKDQREEIIKRSLDRYGVERRGGEYEPLDPSELSGMNDKADEDEDGDESGSVLPSQSVVLESIFTVHSRFPDEEHVKIEDVSDEIQHRSDDNVSAEKAANAIEKTPGEYVDIEQRDGGTFIKLKESGESALFKQDTGSGQTGGGFDHRYLLGEAWRELTRAGYRVELPNQTGGEQPDGIAHSPIDLNFNSFRDAERIKQELKEDYPELYELSQGEDLSIESETSTFKQPAKTLKNLRKSMDAERKCIFAVKDASGEGLMEKHGVRILNILKNPPKVAREEDGKRLFYNKDKALRIDSGVYPLHNSDHKRVAWWEQEDGSLILKDRSSGKVITELDSTESLTDVSRDDFPAYWKYDHGNDSYRVVVNKSDGSTKEYTYNDGDKFKDHWRTVKQPFVPEQEFPYEPEDGDWEVVVFPNDSKDLPPLICKFDGFTEEGNINYHLTPLRYSERGNYTDQLGDSTDEETVEYRAVKTDVMSKEHHIVIASDAEENDAVETLCGTAISISAAPEKSPSDLSPDKLCSSCRVSHDEQ